MPPPPPPNVSVLYYTVTLFQTVKKKSPIKQNFFVMCGFLKVVGMGLNRLGFKLYLRLIFFGHIKKITPRLSFESNFSHVNRFMFICSQTKFVAIILVLLVFFYWSSIDTPTA